MEQLGECLSWVVGTAWELLWCFLGGRGEGSGFLDLLVH